VTDNAFDPAIALVGMAGRFAGAQLQEDYLAFN
jgi:hypothetical protein